MEQISPTRMNLLIKRRQIKIAEQGVNLLKNKRDALLGEFMDLLKPLLKEREELNLRLREAINNLAKVMGIDGPEKLESIAMGIPSQKPVLIEERKLWGVKLPEIKYDGILRSPLMRGYSPFTVSTRIDQTAEAFERVIDLVIRLAPTEIKLKRLGQEIKKTTRRVNALEQKLIPNLKREVKFIRQILEDREREDKFRLKRLKKGE